MGGTINKVRGVYFINDIDSGRLYVGSTEHESRRLSDHKRDLENNRHANPRLQSAHNKGHVLETTFMPLDEHVNIRQVEQVFLDNLFPHDVLLNISRDATAPMKGRKQSPEVVENTRQRMMGNTFTLGHKQTEGHKRNSVAGRAGYTHSEETKAKISESNKGKCLDHLRTPESMEKIRLANLGHTRNLGRTHSEESKAKIGVASMGRTHTVSEESRERMRQLKLGKSFSAEHREKLSLAGLGRVDSEETRYKKFLANAEKAKPVIIDGVSYLSRGIAAKALGVTTSTISNRIKKTES